MANAMVVEAHDVQELPDCFKQLIDTKSKYLLNKYSII